jgi:large subunit ribosomal protein L31e
MAEETEKIYVIPLKKKNYRSSIAAPTAMKRMKQYLVKHMKVEEEDIWIDAPLNHEIWKHGKYNMPNKLRVKAVKFDDGVVEVYLPELEFTKSRREILQEEKAKKTPILIKEEEGEEEEIETGAEDYDVVPTADGDVKIKKKKPEKSDEGEEQVPVEKASSEKPGDEKSEKTSPEKKEKKVSPKKKSDEQKAVAQVDEVTKKSEKTPTEKKDKKASSKKEKESD